MLETSNLARKYTPICSFRKYTFQCLGPLNFADVSIFLQKISVFCPKKYLYSKQQYESCVRDFLVLFSGFVRQKATLTEKFFFADSVSGIRLQFTPNWPKNQKMTMTLQFSDMTPQLDIFDIDFFLLSSLVTCPSFMSISSLVLEL